MTQKKQTNQYDKILKENLAKTLPILVEEILGIKIIAYEELNESIQYTKERKPDVLIKVSDISGKTSLLHIEFQVSDDNNMVYRMAEYAIMLMRKYKLPLLQYVFYFKDTKPKMTCKLRSSFLSYSFPIIVVSDLDYKLFLKSKEPTVKMLGILAKFEQADAYQVITSILQSFFKAPYTELETNKFMSQLRVFMQLRKGLGLEIDFLRAMESISTYFKEEQDVLYRKGEAQGITKGEAQGIIKGEAQGIIKGEAQGKITLIKRLIFKLAFTNEEVAVIADVPIAEIIRIRKAGE